MTQSIDDLVSQAQERFAAAKDAAALENEKARFLGKDGALTVLLKGWANSTPSKSARWARRSTRPRRRSRSS